MSDKPQVFRDLHGTPMQPGQLYACTYYGANVTTGKREWYYKMCLYVGIDPIARDDGRIIFNHSFMVDGKKRITDKTFLRNFYLLTPDNLDDYIALSKNYL